MATKEFPESVDHSVTLMYVDSTGTLVVPTSANYTVSDEDGELVVGITAIDVSGAPSSAVVTIPAASNAIIDGQIRGARTLSISFGDAEGNSHVVNDTYLLAANSTLVKGLNSFAEYGRLLMVAQDMPSYDMLSSSPEAIVKSALAQAWTNIGRLPIYFGSDLADVGSTYDMGVEEIALMDQIPYQALLRAQLIEANFVLGGDPVEDKRRAGILSDSAGESTQFLRTSKPIALPVCKECAETLGPYIKWQTRTGR